MLTFLAHVSPIGSVEHIGMSSRSSFNNENDLRVIHVAVGLCLGATLCELHHCQHCRAEVDCTGSSQFATAARVTTASAYVHIHGWVRGGNMHIWPRRQSDTGVM